MAELICWFPTCGLRVQSSEDSAGIPLGSGNCVGYIKEGRLRDRGFVSLRCRGGKWVLQTKGERERKSEGNVSPAPHFQLQLWSGDGGVQGSRAGGFFIFVGTDLGFGSCWAVSIRCVCSETPLLLLEELIVARFVFFFFLGKPAPSSFVSFL